MLAVDVMIQSPSAVSVTVLFPPTRIPYTMAIGITRTMRNKVVTRFRRSG